MSRSVPDVMPAFHTPCGVWASAHVFFDGGIYGESCDRVITDVLAPFIARAVAHGWIRAFFFIRFPELGPHVRLRMYSDEQVVGRELAPALEQHVAEMVSGARLIPPHVEPAAVTRPSVVGPLRWIAYKPETARYGGEHALSVAEQLFWRSSEVSIGILGAMPTDDRSARLGRALLALVTLLGAFTSEPEEAAAIARLHRDQYSPPIGPNVGGEWVAHFDAGWTGQAENARRQVLSSWQAVTQNLELPSPLDAYHAAVCAVRDRLDHLLQTERLYSALQYPVQGWPHARRILLPSYGHMTNNRLGVSPLEEAYLVHILARALDR